MSKKIDNMVLVQGALERYGPASYHDLAVRTGLSHAAVCKAVMNLRSELHLAIAIPTRKEPNGYRVSLGWDRAARLGEENQAKHLATRLTSQANRLKIAADVTEDPMESKFLDTLAVMNKAQAEVQQTLSEAMQSK